MTDAAAWLEAETARAPESLRRRMSAAVRTAAGVSIHETLADAALARLKAAAADPAGNEAALNLLSADALLTHAFAAAAESGSETLADLASTLDAARFQQLLDADD